MGKVEPSQKGLELEREVGEEYLSPPTLSNTLGLVRTDVCCDVQQTLEHTPPPPCHVQVAIVSFSPLYFLLNKFQ